MLVKHAYFQSNCVWTVNIILTFIVMLRCSFWRSSKWKKKKWMTIVLTQTRTYLAFVFSYCDCLWPHFEVNNSSSRMIGGIDTRIHWMLAARNARLPKNVAADNSIIGMNTHTRTSYEYEQHPQQSHALTMKNRKKKKNAKHPEKS